MRSAPKDIFKTLEAASTLNVDSNKSALTSVSLLLGLIPLPHPKVILMSELFCIRPPVNVKSLIKEDKRKRMKERVALTLTRKWSTMKRGD